MRTITRAALLTTFLGAALMGVTNPAQAAPTNCRTGTEGTNTGFAYCGGGTGSYRVTITCRRAGNYYIRNGVWEPVRGNLSRKPCYGRDQLTYVGVQKTN
jgi:hypothetical protein